MTKPLDDFVRDVRNSGLLAEPDLRARLARCPLTVALQELCIFNFRELLPNGRSGLPLREETRH